jgi:2-pyrone-4,6-dicarboxylate lactonase
MTYQKMISEPLLPVKSIAAPNFSIPPLSCDSHMHVFGAEEIYPAVSDARYTRPDGDLEQYLKVAEVLQLERIVFVQPSFYGTDNACMLDAMAKLGDRCRGVVFMPDRPKASLIDQFRTLGVRGVRLDLYKLHQSGTALTEILRRVDEAANVAKAVGWHVELYSPGRVTTQILDSLKSLDIDFSINHLGYMTREAGLTDEDFRQFLELGQSEHCWVKLTAPYRVDDSNHTHRTDWMARELIAAMPDRLVWGSDWPHIPTSSRDTGELLNRLARWCPDERTRQRILADNPARLYQFGDV